jgi:hypothetical protein
MARFNVAMMNRRICRTRDFKEFESIMEKYPSNVEVYVQYAQVQALFICCHISKAAVEIPIVLRFEVLAQLL